MGFRHAQTRDAHAGLARRLGGFAALPDHLLREALALLIHC